MFDIEKKELINVKNNYAAALAENPCIIHVLCN
jgi:hypothetical protein